MSENSAIVSRTAIVIASWLPPERVSDPTLDSLVRHWLNAIARTQRRVRPLWDAEELVQHPKLPVWIAAGLGRDMYFEAAGAAYARRPPEFGAEAGFARMVLVSDGVSMSSEGVRGLAVDAEGLMRLVPRHASVPVDVLVAELGLTGMAKEVFKAKGRLLYRNERVPYPQAQLVRHGFQSVITVHAAKSMQRHLPEALEEFAVRGLTDAKTIDALQLAEKAKRTCGKSSMINQRAGRPTLICCLKCKSFRCKHCAKVKGFNEQQRLKAQGERDVAAGRPPWVFGTVTMRPSDAATVEKLASILPLFRELGKGLRGRFGNDLAYWYTVETHASGAPHVHFFLRAAALNDEMLRCAYPAKRPMTQEELQKHLAVAKRGATRDFTGREGRPPTRNERAKMGAELERNAHPEVRDVESRPRADWSSLCDEISDSMTRQEEAKTQGVAIRAPCPFSLLRQEVNDMAVACGFGEAGFYLAPVLDMAAAIAYLTYDNKLTRGTTDKACKEVTKTTQIPVLLPRNFRRFRPSGTKGNGKESSFYLDEVTDGVTDGAPVQPPTVRVEIIRASASQMLREAKKRADIQLVGKVSEGVEFFEPTPPRGEKRALVTKGFSAATDGPTRSADVREQHFRLTLDAKSAKAMRAADTDRYSEVGRRPPSAKLAPLGSAVNRPTAVAEATSEPQPPVDVASSEPQSAT